MQRKSPALNNVHAIVLMACTLFFLAGCFSPTIPLQQTVSDLDAVWNSKSFETPLNQFPRSFSGLKLNDSKKLQEIQTDLNGFTAKLESYAQDSSREIAVHYLRVNQQYVLFLLAEFSVQTQVNTISSSWASAATSETVCRSQLSSDFSFLQASVSDWVRQGVALESEYQTFLISAKPSKEMFTPLPEQAVDLKNMGQLQNRLGVLAPEYQNVCAVLTELNSFISDFDLQFSAEGSSCDSGKLGALQDRLDHLIQTLQDSVLGTTQLLNEFGILSNLQSTLPEIKIQAQDLSSILAAQVRECSLQS